MKRVPPVPASILRPEQEPERAEVPAMQYIAFDAHKHYTLASVEREDGRLVREQQIPHERSALQGFLQGCDPGSPVAVETTGNWYWIADEIEGAGCLPQLVHARKAKLMMGMPRTAISADPAGRDRYLK